MENKELKNYETVIIINGSYTEKEYQDALEKITNYIEDLAKIEKVEEIGLKRLAYEVSKQNTGYYIIVEFKAVEGNIKELERFYRIDDDVLKFIVVRKED